MAGRFDIKNRFRDLLGLPTHRREPSTFDALDPVRIVETAEVLSRRIGERFPQSGLLGVCRHLTELARDAGETATWIDRPLIGLRVATGVLAALIVFGVVFSVLSVESHGGHVSVVDLVSGLEAGINDVVLIGAGIFFLVTLETRIKRRRALEALHRLRVVAHIIDMHQLTKSPERIAADHQRTESSPRVPMTPFELGRYLDYCTEMLSLTGKIAALYVQHFEDGVALVAVNEIEDLTTGLSRKIWQKLVSLRAVELSGDP